MFPLPLICLLAQILCVYNPMAGASYERASSAKGRDGVLIQDWRHGGQLQTKKTLFSLCALDHPQFHC